VSFYIHLCDTDYLYVMVTIFRHSRLSDIQWSDKTYRNTAFRIRLYVCMPLSVCVRVSLCVNSWNMCYKFTVLSLWCFPLISNQNITINVFLSRATNLKKTINRWPSNIIANYNETMGSSEINTENTILKDTCSLTICSTFSLHYQMFHTVNMTGLHIGLA